MRVRAASALQLEGGAGIPHQSNSRGTVELIYHLNHAILKLEKSDPIMPIRSL